MNGALTLENIIIDGNKEMNSWHPVIRVENGSLNISQGTIIQNNNSHSEGAISLLNSTFTMSGGEIKDNISSILGGAIFSNNTVINLSGNARITNNTVTAESDSWNLSDEEKKGAHGGALYLEGKSTVNISENVEISNNSCFYYGGGIFAWDSTITMNGGKISNNKALKGGGIYTDGNSILNLNNGEISENEVKTNPNLPDYNVNIGGCGGGLMIINSSATLLDGFNILKNKAEIEGGGLQIFNSTLTMNGGKIDGNIANINGGGFLLGNGSNVTITAGYISNNVCDLTKFKFDFMDDPNAVLGTMDSLGTGSEFAGGGIYLHSGCSLHISNAIIAENTNDQSIGMEAYPDKSAIRYSGSGLAFCPTSNVKIYSNNGCAIYGNGGNDSFDIVQVPKAFVTDYNFSHGVDEETKPILYNSNYALGGGFYGWTDYFGEPIITGYYNGNKRVALKSHLSDEDIQVANSLATVFITGNTSRGIFGAGGIACNGLLTIGDSNSAMTTALKVEKHAEKNATLVTDEFSFNVTLKGDNIDKLCRAAYISDANGTKYTNLTWNKEADIYSTTITLNVNEEGYGKFYLINIPDKTEYTISEKCDNSNFKTEVKILSGNATTNNNIVTGTIDVNSDSNVDDTIEEDGAFTIKTALSLSFNNDYPLGNLEVTKTVINDSSDKVFTFTMTLDNTRINGIFGDMEFINGIATFTLKNGESKKAIGLPVGTNYKVSESNTEGYEVTCTKDTGTILENTNIKVEFINTKIEDKSIIPSILPNTGLGTLLFTFGTVILFSMIFAFTKIIKLKKLGKF